MWKFDSDRPIYIQIVDKIRMKIASGEYRPGEKLPSVRELAAEAAVNPNTMQRAFSGLEEEGLVVTHRTAGRSVCLDGAAIENCRRELAEKTSREYLANMALLGYSPETACEFIKKTSEDFTNG